MQTAFKSVVAMGESLRTLKALCQLRDKLH